MAMPVRSTKPSTREYKASRIQGPTAHGKAEGAEGGKDARRRRTRSGRRKCRGEGYVVPSTPNAHCRGVDEDEQPEDEAREAPASPHQTARRRDGQRQGAQLDRPGRLLRRGGRSADRRS